VHLGHKTFTGAAVFKTLLTFAATATISFVLAIGSASVSAQDKATNDRPGTSASNRPVDDREFNYGWLGLAGLLGLLGLLPRNRATNDITVRDGAGNVKSSARP
jgi:hypothetical protein